MVQVTGQAGALEHHHGSSTLQSPSIVGAKRSLQPDANNIGQGVAVNGIDAEAVLTRHHDFGEGAQEFEVVGLGALHFEDGILDPLSIPFTDASDLT